MNTTSRAPILLALGEEDINDGVLRFAVDEALRQDRPLALVHVVDPPSSGMVPEQLLISFKSAELVARQMLSRYVERAEDLVEGRVPITKSLRRGPVVDQLVEAADSADHIVLQHRQQGRLRRVFTGSVAAGVASRAKVPVVSVPELWSKEETRRVLVAIDGVRGNEGLLRKAFDEASTRNATLVVLHAWYLPSIYDDALADRGSLVPWQERARERINRQVEPMRDAYPTVAVTIEMPRMRPAEAIVEAADTSDLALVGRSATRGRPHLGSLTRALLREIRSPLVVVNPATGSDQPEDEGHAVQSATTPDDVPVR